MNRYRYASAVTVLILSLAGCSSTVGPTTSGSFSAPAQDATYSPLPQIPPIPERTITKRPHARITIVVDVDDTLCVTDYTCVIMGIGSDSSRPFANAARTLRGLAKKYDILYLTARPAAVSHRTKRWLKKHGFPDGPVLGSRNMIDFIAQTDFKIKTLARLHRERKGMLIGIGDRPRDAEAYRANQMLPVIVYPCSGGKYHPNDLLFKDWDCVARFFEANEDILLNPLSLTDNIKSGELRIMLPG